MSGAKGGVRWAVIALVAVVALAAVAAIVGREIRSPAQIAADAAPPRASLISVPVERRALATEVIVRGTVRYGAPQPVVMPLSALKSSTSVVSRVRRPGTRLAEGAIALAISGRPVFVLQGATPMHRDLGPGVEGEDVAQLERALGRFGFSPGSEDGHYDGATAAAVAAFYLSRNETPFGATDAQLSDLRAAAQSAATARDAHLQTRLALRTAARGATAAERNQARLDAAAAAEAITPARLAIATGESKVVTAGAAIANARVAEAQAPASADRDIAAADADVVSKRAAAGDALDQVTVAQQKLRDAPPPPETPPGDYEALKAAVTQAQRAVDVANAALAAAERGAAAARTTLGFAVEKARGDGRQAGVDLVLARAELRAARAGLRDAKRKRAIADARVRILQQRPTTALEQRIVASSRREADRTQTELNRLARRLGVQVPADEVLFFEALPLRVDSLAARRGSPVQAAVMTVSNARLAIDSSLSVLDAKLVRPGMRVAIEEQQLRAKLRGRVSRVADKPGTLPADLVGTNTPDPTRTYLEILPRAAPQSLVGASVKLSIAVRATNGKVLAVPVGALSISADGKSRVQVDRGGGKTRIVTVSPGLAAQGLVEVSPEPKGALTSADLVVVGTRGSSSGP